MKFFVVLLGLLHLSIVLAEDVGVDYYWRNYDGKVPSDAVLGGTDKSGNVYVGQGFFKNVGPLPGTLHPGSTNISVTAEAKVFSTEKYVKILCSQHPEKFQWTTVKYSAIPELKNVHLVEGGWETDSVVNIGRTQRGDNVEIGKVYNVAPYQGLTLPSVGGSEDNYKDFDILTYQL